MRHTGFRIFPAHDAWNTRDPETFATLTMPAPCDECPLRQRCADEKLACPAFVRFVRGSTAWGKAGREPSPELYRAIMREEYDYGREGRRDPFVSLLTTNELRPTISDLKLTGVLYDHSGTNSVATLRDLTDNKQYRVKTGTTLGRMRVTAIKTTTVIFTIDEFGTTRQDSLILRDPTKARAR